MKSIIMLYFFFIPGIQIKNTSFVPSIDWLIKLALPTHNPAMMSIVGVYVCAFYYVWDFFSHGPTGVPEIGRAHV